MAREFWVRYESILPSYGCQTKHAYETEQPNSLRVIDKTEYDKLERALAIAEGALAEICDPRNYSKEQKEQSWQWDTAIEAKKKIKEAREGLGE